MKFATIGNYGVGNIGDDAILLGLTELLKKVDPKAEIVVMGKGSLFPLGIRSFIASIFNWSLWKKPAAKAKSADIIILGGGGLLTDEERPLTAAFWAFQALTAVFLTKKPLWVLGVHIGQLGFLSKILVNKVLKKAQLITVRDEMSMHYLINNSFVGHLLPDLAYFVTHELVTNKQNSVLISLKPHRYIDDRMINIFVQVCKYIVDKGYSVKLIPFQREVHSDVALLNKIFVQLNKNKKVTLCNYSADVFSVLKEFSSAKFAISMRFHGGIFSCITNTPFINIQYMDKGYHFKSLRGVECLTISTLTLKSLEEAFLRLVSSTESFNASYSPNKTTSLLTATLTKGHNKVL